MSDEQYEKMLAEQNALLARIAAALERLAEEGLRVKSLPLKL